MSKISLNSNLVQQAGKSLEFQGDAAVAQTKLREVAESLVSSSGSVRSGYLRLAKHQNHWDFGTNHFRKTDSTDHARDMIRSMVKTAYGEHAGVESALRNYLDQSKQRVGTRSFVKLIHALETAKGGHLSEKVEKAIPKATARLESGHFGASMALSQEIEDLTRQVSEARSALTAPAALTRERLGQIKTSQEHFRNRAEELAGELDALAQSAEVQDALGQLQDGIEALDTIHQQGSVRLELQTTLEDSRLKFEQANQWLSKPATPTRQQTDALTQQIASLSAERTRLDAVIASDEAFATMSPVTDARASLAAQIDALSLLRDVALARQQIETELKTASSTASKDFLSITDLTTLKIARDTAARRLEAAEGAVQDQPAAAPLRGALATTTRSQLAALDARIETHEARRDQAQSLLSRGEFKEAIEFAKRQSPRLAISTQVALAALQDGATEAVKVGLSRGAARMELQAGGYREAARNLTQGAQMSAADMGRFLVDECLDGRAVNARLVQFGEAAFGTGADQVDSLAEFALAALTGTGPADATDADISRFQSLFTFVMLVRSRQPAQSEALALRLAELLAKRHAGSAPAATMAEQLRSAAPLMTAEDGADQISRRLQVALQGLSLSGRLLGDALNSSLPDLQLVPQDGMPPSDIVGSIVNYDSTRGNWANLGNSDLSGSDITITITFEGAARARFEGANLTDANVRIDYSRFANNLRYASSPQATMRSRFDHLSNDGVSRMTPLFTIASIDDAHAELKVSLMRDLLEFITRYDSIIVLKDSLCDILLQSPLFLADARIRELLQPIWPDLLRSLAAKDSARATVMLLDALATSSPSDRTALLGELPVARRDAMGQALASSPQLAGRETLLYELVKPKLEGLLGGAADADPGATHQRVRDNIVAINRVLHAVENDPARYPQAMRDELAQWRAAVNQLPEVRSIAGTIAAMYAYHTRADGEEIEDPWYYELGADGRIAALTWTSFDQVARRAPEAQLITNTLFFLPQDQRYGEAIQDYLPAGSDHVLLVNKQINDRGPALLESFPLLGAAYREVRPTPASLLIGSIFKDNATIDGWFRDALKGMPTHLDNRQQLVMEEQFASVAGQVFTDPDMIADTLRWPNLNLSAGFKEQLRSLATEAGVDPADRQAFARYLMTQSTLFARLSSKDVFGNELYSIPSLRVLGYALMKEAQQTDPGMLEPKRWNNLEDRYLNRNNAMDCAALISDVQISDLTKIDPAAFSKLMPEVFQKAIYS